MDSLSVEVLLKPSITIQASPVLVLVVVTTFLINTAKMFIGQGRAYTPPFSYSHQRSPMAGATLDSPLPLLGGTVVSRNSLFSESQPPRYGLMARMLSSKKKLVCFGCGTKSALTYDGLIDHWKCGHCDFDNWLDTNGEITDPPVSISAQYIAPSERSYAVPRQPFTPSQQSQFCDGCQLNQHLYISALAQYDDVLYDPYDPRHKENRLAIEKYKEGLEKRYPQVCENCVQYARDGMKAGQKIAQTEHIGRLLERTQKGYSKKPWKKSDFGRIFWWVGLYGYMAWSFASLLSILPLEDLEDLKAFQYQSSSTLLDVFRWLIAFVTSEKWVYRSFVCSLVSFWWNPYFSESSRGHRAHLHGIRWWYGFHAITLAFRTSISRSMKWDVLANPHNHAISSSVFHVACISLTFCLTLLTMRSIKVDMSPLWGAIPDRFKYVAPKARPGSPEMLSMVDQLSRIRADSPTMYRPITPPSFQRRNHSPPEDKNRIYSTNFSLPSTTQGLHELPKPGPSFQPFQPTYSGKNFQLREQSPVQARTSDFVSNFASLSTDSPTPKKQTQFQPQSSQPQLFQNTTFAEESMDWTPSGSKHRAFNPSTRDPTAKLFGDSPVTDTPTAFWFKVPPAPVTPAQRLYNPPNQARLRVTSQETRQTFFEKQDTNQGRGLQDRDAGRYDDFEMAPPKFFAPEANSQATDELVDMLGSMFTLSDVQIEQVRRNPSKIRTFLKTVAFSFGVFLVWQVWLALFGN